MKTRLFSLIFFLLFGGATASFSAEKLPSFTVGTTSGYAPYVSLDDKGNYEGFDIDLARALAKKLGRELVIKDFGSMPSLMIALNQGKVDALIWAISITEERQQKMEMVYYQGEKVLSMPFLFWKEIPEGVQSIDDLKKTVSVEAGTYQDDVMRKFPNVQVKYNDKITDAILEIKYGKSGSAVVDPSLVRRFLSEYPEIKALNLPLPQSEQSLGNGICLRKTSSALAAEVRKAIEELTTDGTIASLEKKWNLGSE